ncbi:MAG: hypothetical protein IPN17_31610 [Deltaproteobacteria bacterium]|nr:hypothetical protein [Deltaproteobacteria bacterium]
MRHLERVARLAVRWRPGSAAAWRTAVAVRDSGAWRVDLPAQPITARALDYYVVLELVDGSTRASFASAESPHRVVLRPEESDERELIELTRNRGRRLELTGGGEYTDFGSAPNEGGARCGAASGATCPDHWYTLWGEVRYRFYRRVRSVAVRVDRLDGQTTRSTFEGPRTRDVGLVAATASVEFRLVDMVSVHLLGTLGANEETVQVGGGLRLDVGTGAARGGEPWVPGHHQLRADGVGVDALGDGARHAPRGWHRAHQPAGRQRPVGAAAAGRGRSPLRAAPDRAGAGGLRRPAAGRGRLHRRGLGAGRVLIAIGRADAAAFSLRMGSECTRCTPTPDISWLLSPCC